MAMTKQIYKNDCIILGTLEELVPEEHLLRKLDNCIDFRFIEDLVKDLYSKDTISKTKTIKVKDHQSITEEKEINTFLSVINNSKVWTGAVTLLSPKYELELFDVNNNSIAKILYNPSHYFSIEINKKSYKLTNIDQNSLNTILDK